MSANTEGPSGARVGIRAMATVIDSVVIGAGYFIYAGLYRLVSGDLGRMPGIPIALFIVLGALYFFWFEWKFGATIGKRVLHLSVVMEDGKPITQKAAATRTLMRIIDGQILYLVAAIAVWASPQHQRLGDMLAKTVVIYK
jgi:uncharacterized RDD family membrane protein YckC